MKSLIKKSMFVGLIAGSIMYGSVTAADTQNTTTNQCPRGYENCIRNENKTNLRNRKNLKNNTNHNRRFLNRNNQNCDGSGPERIHKSK